MDKALQDALNNPWTVTIVGGIVAAVVGGVVATITIEILRWFIKTISLPAFLGGIMGGVMGICIIIISIAVFTITLYLSSSVLLSFGVTGFVGLSLVFLAGTIIGVTAVLSGIDSRNSRNSRNSSK